MADQLQLRGGTTTEHATFTGALREVTVDTDKKTVVVHDGSTAGGNPLLRQDLSNLPAGTIDNADINASAGIVDTKLATIATAGKVSNSATTATSTNTNSAIVARDASGNFTAGTVTANLSTGLGTVALPSIAITGDANTGIYSPGADQLAISTGGVQRLLVNSSGITTSGLNGGPLSGARNRIINGDMRIDQRNAGAAIAYTAATQSYLVDRFVCYLQQASKFTIQQNQGAVTPPAGFTNYLGFTSSAATSPGSTDLYAMGHKIEGFNVSDLAWGTASAQPITLSFWVRSSLTGTFGGSFFNSAANRNYVFSYTISAANTWEQKSVTIAGDTSGTWLTTSGTGIQMWWNLGSGSSSLGAAGSWGATGFYGPTGATSVVGTNGATFYITGVQLETGTVATPFERRSYGQELALAQRYYENVGGGFGRSKSSGVMDFSVNYLTEKRASPSVTLRTGSWTATQIGFGSRTITGLNSIYNAQTQMCTGAVAATSFVIEENGYLVGVPLAVSAEL